MRPTRIVLCLLASGLTVGCMSSQRKPFATNPLLLYYKPTLSDSSTILAEQAARREPMKPPMPAFARDNTAAPPTLLRRPESDDIKPVKIELPEPEVKPVIRQSSASSREPDLKIDVGLPIQPVEKKPVVTATMELVVMTQKIDLPNVPTGPITMTSLESVAVRRKQISGTYGHDLDYGWLQGTVQRLARGGCFIRFCDPSVENEYGGKFRVEDEALLAPYRDGEIVGVTGERAEAPRGQDPGYRVREVWRVPAK
ncbi:MAG: hypothetical protein ACJ8F7_09725 [Gemmataceae bacterium]